MRRSILIMLSAADVVLVLLNIFHEKVFLSVINAKGGCYPWSPAIVEYHQGMTLCPGQTTIMVPVERSGI